MQFKNNFKKLIIYSRFQEILENIFNKYYHFIYELIKITIPFNGESKKISINQNPIIAFYIYESECCNVNFMKTKCFQFITFFTKKFFFKSNTNNNIFDSYIIIKN